MFDNIRLHRFDFPGSFRSNEVKSPSTELSQAISSKRLHQMQDELNDRLFNYRLTGAMDSFPIHPVCEFTHNNLYYIESFTINHSKFGFMTTRKDYPSYLIIYTYEGKGVLKYRNQTYQLSEGDGFFIDCNEYQEYYSNQGDWVHSDFHIQGPLLHEMFQEFASSGQVVFHQPLNGSYQQQLEHILTTYQLNPNYRDWYISAEIYQLMVSLLTTYGSASNTGSDRIQYLITYMNDNYTNTMDMNYLSNFSGLNKQTLYEQFKKHTGFSPNDYLIHVRINHAKTLLLSTDLSILEVAHSVGISDVNNFINLFKKRTGMTPGKFRKQY